MKIDPGFTPPVPQDDWNLFAIETEANTMFDRVRVLAAGSQLILNQEALAQYVAPASNPENIQPYQISGAIIDPLGRPYRVLENAGDLFDRQTVPNPMV